MNYFNKQMNNMDADDAKLQFEEFVTYLAMQHADGFNTFDMLRYVKVSIILY